MKLLRTIIFLFIPISFVVFFAFLVGTMYEGELIWTILMLISIAVSITLMVASIAHAHSVDDDYIKMTRRHNKERLK